VVDIFGRGGEPISKVNAADDVIIEEEDNEDEQSSQAPPTQVENLTTNQNILYTATKDLQDDQ